MSGEYEVRTTRLTDPVLTYLIQIILLGCFEADVTPCKPHITLRNYRVVLRDELELVLQVAQQLVFCPFDHVVLSASHAVFRLAILIRADKLERGSFGTVVTELLEVGVVRNLVDRVAAGNAEEPVFCEIDN